MNILTVLMLAGVGAAAYMRGKKDGANEWAKTEVDAINAEADADVAQTEAAAAEFKAADEALESGEVAVVEESVIVLDPQFPEDQSDKRDPY